MTHKNRKKVSKLSTVKQKKIFFFLNFICTLFLKFLVALKPDPDSFEIPDPNSMNPDAQH
jgi:hypothetical protein